MEKKTIPNLSNKYPLVPLRATGRMQNSPWPAQINGFQLYRERAGPQGEIYAAILHLQPLPFPQNIFCAVVSSTPGGWVNGRWMAKCSNLSINYNHRI